MRCMEQYTDRLAAKGSRPLAWRMFLLFAFPLFLDTAYVNAQCPNNDETKVIKPNDGTGYYFYRFLGENSFRYFLDGKTFSYNDKDDPGRTFIFIDDVAYELNLVGTADFAEFIKGSKPIDILRAHAKYEQKYQKQLNPSMVITDFGPPSNKNDGSNDRSFYLSKKENPPGKQAATQYFLSTLVKDKVVVLSIILLKSSVCEDDVFIQIQKYTSNFDLISSDQCAKVLAMPIAP